MLSCAKDSGIKYALVSNIGQIENAKKYGFEIIADFRFNIFNSYTLEFLNGLGIKRAIVSPELSQAQLRDFKNQGVIAYGKLPIMVTQKCVLKDTVGCKAGKGYLKDRQGAMLYARCDL
jgi:putative protease